MRVLIASLLLGVALSGSAFAQSPADAPLPAAVSLVEANGGWAFVNDDGLTLYTFDRDSNGVSACEGQCATAWPPLTAAADAHVVGDWTPIRRGDGSMQWAYRGKPIYTFARDGAAGQSNGDGMGGVWHVVRPQ